MKKILFTLTALVAVSVILLAGAAFAGKPSAAPAAAAPAATLAAELSVSPELTANTAATAPFQAAAVPALFGVIAVSAIVIRRRDSGESGLAKFFARRFTVGLSLGRFASFTRRVRHAAFVATGWALIGLGKFLDVFLEKMTGKRLSSVMTAAAQTAIADLWTPAIWIPGLRELVVQAPSIINSGAVVRSPIFEEVATGGGTEGNIPFLKEPNPDDVIQIEDTAPTINNVTSALQKCPILNRVSPIGASALSRAITAKPGASAALTDPVTLALSVIADIRLRQRQKTLLAIVRGAFGSQANNGDSPSLKALRLENFSETLNTTATNFIDTNMMLDALALLGERKEKMVGGAVVMHSVIEAALSKQDQIDYVRNSSGEILLRMWKGCPVYLSDLLVRAGTTSGFVYDTYFFMPGSIAMGDKPQVAQVGEVASLIMDLTQVAKNNIAIYDRTRFVLHVNGMKWVGTPAGQSATNTELQLSTNWNLAFGEVKNVGIVQLQTNG